MTCPCGTGLAEAACCGAYLAGAPAPTALALMRSRYTAYVRGAVDYLVETHATPPDRAAIAARCNTTVWRGLEIIASEPGETESFVEFIARGETGGAPFAQRERSRFLRRAGRWMYVDAATPGRNEPCPCGSGKKYKRCHGASR